MELQKFEAAIREISKLYSLQEVVEDERLLELENQLSWNTIEVDVDSCSKANGVDTILSQIEFCCELHKGIFSTSKEFHQHPEFKYLLILPRLVPPAFYTVQKTANDSLDPEKKHCRPRWTIQHIDY